MQSSRLFGQMFYGEMQNTEVLSVFSNDTLACRILALVALLSFGL